MGTNYYLMTNNKSLVRKYFAKLSEDGDYIISTEYDIVDEPMLGYEIHLNKCSCGWRPLFQKHKCFKTFEDLRLFYNEHYDSLWIYDEYGRNYSWDDYEQLIMDHASMKPEPIKWVYDYDRLWRSNKKYLHTIRCDPEEAELFTPFDHIEYARTEKEAAKRLHCESYSSDLDYTNDPKYPVDWVSGEFS